MTEEYIKRLEEANQHLENELVRIHDENKSKEETSENLIKTLKLSLKKSLVHIRTLVGWSEEAKYKAGYEQIQNREKINVGAKKRFEEDHLEQIMKHDERYNDQDYDELVERVIRGK